jgi:hypothetical protein
MWRVFNQKTGLGLSYLAIGDKRSAEKEEQVLRKLNSRMADRLAGMLLVPPLHRKCFDVPDRAATRIRATVSLPALTPSNTQNSTQICHLKNAQTCHEIGNLLPCRHLAM